jgi:hypothetical protein
MILINAISNTNHKVTEKDTEEDELRSRAWIKIPFSDASQKRWGPRRFCEASLNETVSFDTLDSVATDEHR